MVVYMTALLVYPAMIYSFIAIATSTAAILHKRCYRGLHELSAFKTCERGQVDHLPGHPDRIFSIYMNFRLIF